jgi:hypothetical protein
MSGRCFCREFRPCRFPRLTVSGKNQGTTQMDKIEYRVRPVTRFIVTRYGATCKNGVEGNGVITLGEYDNAEVAHEVGYALCKSEHDRLGWPLGDERITYPQRFTEGVQIGGPSPDRDAAFAARVADAERCRREWQGLPSD